MSKIRKQPRRTSKKQKSLSFRNPFLSNTPFLPQSIANNLRHMENLFPKNLDQIIAQPQDSPEINIRIMKQALELQQIKINQMKSLMAKIKQEEGLSDIKKSEGEEQKQSNELLGGSIQPNIIDWAIHQNQSVSFF